MSLLSTTSDALEAQRSKLAARLLLPAAFITTAGNAFQITAAAILVYRAGQNTVSVGWLFIAVSIPQVILSVLFGRLTDRFDRRTLSVISDVASAIIAFALPVWLWLHANTEAGSYVASFLLACGAALFMPASNALVKERIRDESLVKYNAGYEMATNAGMLLASSSAGFLVSALGPIPLFIANSGTFVLSAALTWAIGARQERPAAAAADGAAAAETGSDESAQAAPAPAVKPPRSPILRLGLLYTSGNLNLMVANVILTTLELQYFAKGPWLVGVVDALAGFGFITGAAAHGWLAARIPSLRLALIGALACCVVIVVETSNYIVLMCAIPFAGFWFANFRIAARTMLMKASPEERVGRIFGNAQAAGLAMGIAATLGLSTLADHTKVPDAFYGLAILIGGISLFCYFSLLRPMAQAAAAAEAQQQAAPAPTVLVPASAEGEPA